MAYTSKVIFFCIFVIVAALIGMWRMAVQSDAVPFGSVVEALMFLCFVGMFLSLFESFGGNPSQGGRNFCRGVGLFVVYFLVGSVYTQTGPDIMWRKDGRLTKTAFSLPFTRIDLVLLRYSVGMSRRFPPDKLSVMVEYSPDQEILLHSRPQEIREALYQHIGARLALLESPAEKDRLQEMVSVLPERLSGEISVEITVEALDP